MGVFMADNVRELRPRTPDTERSRSTLAMSTSVTSISWCRKGSIEPYGFHPDGHRNQLERHADVVKQSTARKSLDLGLRNYSRDDLQAAQRAGEMLQINVLGLATIAQDVTPELARATIASVSVPGPCMPLPRSRPLSPTG